MRALIWTPRARLDLEEIDFFYRQLDPALADRIGDSVLLAPNVLLENSRMGPAIDATRRKWRVEGTPYRLIYRPTAGAISILRVRHVAQDALPE